MTGLAAFVRFIRANPRLPDDDPAFAAVLAAYLADEAIRADEAARQVALEAHR